MPSLIGLRRTHDILFHKITLKHICQSQKGPNYRWSMSAVAVVPTGCPREPYPLGFWVTTFILWTYMGTNIWQMKTELLRIKMSTHSLPES